MSNELDYANSKMDALERRVRYCEEIARQYAKMYEQLQRELNILLDRQNNIQTLYDYLTRVGSDISKKNPDLKRSLNPITKTLSPTDKRYNELIKSFKFKAGDDIYYADELNDCVTYHLVNAVDIIDEHPRYKISDIHGYVDEGKLFKTEGEAHDQLFNWKTGYY